ncbi:MAG: cysteine--tRNA ligase, partial [Caldiserica bacterium]
MKIFDTLKKKKVDFIPQKKDEARIYVCGITPYDYTHIGHARSYVFFDSLRRYLKYRGYKVIYVQNFTDIDDKIINRSKKEGISWKELADKYIDAYWKDIRRLGVIDPDVSPKVSEHINEIVGAVEKLLEKGYAYRISDGIYFDVSKFKD